MIELHGWMAVRETYGDEDLLSREQLDGIMRKVRETVEGNSFGVRLLSRNGSFYLDTLLDHNHRTGDVVGVIELYKAVAQAATGSYGVIYLRDDEDAVHSNEFQVFVFKRGKCCFRTDTDFSPCIPVIEDSV